MGQPTRDTSEPTHEDAATSRPAPQRRNRRRKTRYSARVLRQTSRPTFRSRTLTDAHGPRGDVGINQHLASPLCPARTLTTAAMSAQSSYKCWMFGKGAEPPLARSVHASLVSDLFRLPTDNRQSPVSDPTSAVAIRQLLLWFQSTRDWRAFATKTCFRVLSHVAVTIRQQVTFDRSRRQSTPVQKSRRTSIISSHASCPSFETALPCAPESKRHWLGLATRVDMPRTTRGDFATEQKLLPTHL